jgi:hypothetical protein
MDAEEEFGIAIADHAMQDVVTVGAFHDLVVGLVRAGGSPELRDRPHLEEHLWSRIRALAAEHGYDATPDQITRSTRFVEDLGYG